MLGGWHTASIEQLTKCEFFTPKLPQGDSIRATELFSQRFHLKRIGQLATGVERSVNGEHAVGWKELQRTIPRERERIDKQM